MEEVNCSTEMGVPALNSASTNGSTQMHRIQLLKPINLATQNDFFFLVLMSTPLKGVDAFYDCCACSLQIIKFKSQGVKYIHWFYVPSQLNFKNEALEAIKEFVIKVNLPKVPIILII